MSLLISYRQLICSFDLVPGQKKAASSKTEMLRFALPALGIYLANPIMSNIDPLASLTFCVGCLTWFWISCFYMVLVWQTQRKDRYSWPQSGIYYALFAQFLLRTYLIRIDMDPSLAYTINEANIWLQWFCSIYVHLVPKLFFITTYHFFWYFLIYTVSYKIHTVCLQTNVEIQTQKIETSNLKLGFPSTFVSFRWNHLRTIALLGISRAPPHWRLWALEALLTYSWTMGTYEFQYGQVQNKGHKHRFAKTPGKGVPFFLGVAGGVLADNLFFLFNSVLSAATTGLVARAWPKGVKNAREETGILRCLSLTHFLMTITVSDCKWW